jgi:hypothetical protein
MLGRRMKVVVRERRTGHWRDGGEALLRDLAVGLWYWRVELAGVLALVALDRLLAAVVTELGAAAVVAALAGGALVMERSRVWLVDTFRAARVRRSWDRAVLDVGAAAGPWRAPRVLSIAHAPIGEVLRVRVQRGFSVSELEARSEPLAACLRVRGVRVVREAGDGSLATVVLVRRDPFADVDALPWPKASAFAAGLIVLKNGSRRRSRSRASLPRVTSARTSAAECATRSRRGWTAGGTSRALASAQASLAQIVRSAWSRTRSSRRTRSGDSAHSFLTRRDSGSAAA